MLYPWNVIGHEKELHALENDLKENRVHHAYLFVGPEKIGKFRIAKAFAGILQCPHDFCHHCHTCLQIEKKCHLDTIELDDKGESIKIQDIRDVINRLSMTNQNNYKILLIEGIGRLTEEAGNALLKTIEEPSPKTIFLFTASQLRDIMPTIASRMRLVYFKKLPDETLKTALKNLSPKLDEDTLNQIVLLSLGRSGTALKLLAEPELFQEFRDLYRQIQFLREKASLSTRLVASQEISQDPKKIKLFLSLLTHDIRRVLLQGFPSQQRYAMQILENIHRVMDLLTRNINPRLLLDHIMMQL